MRPRLSVVWLIALVAFATQPVVAARGLKLKRYKPLFNIELANGWYGHIPPSEQFPLGTYETWRMRTSYLETNAIPKMVAAFIDLLKTLPIP